MRKWCPWRFSPGFWKETICRFLQQENYKLLENRGSGSADESLMTFRAFSLQHAYEDFRKIDILDFAANFQVLSCGMLNDIAS